MLQPHIQAGEYKKTSLLWCRRLECMYVGVSGGRRGDGGGGMGMFTLIALTLSLSHSQFYDPQSCDTQ